MKKRKLKLTENLISSALEMLAVLKEITEELEFQYDVCSEEDSEFEKTRVRLCKAAREVIAKAEGI